MEKNIEIREFYGAEVLQFEKLATVLFRSKNANLSDEEEYKKILVEEDKKRGKDFFRIGAFCDGKLWAAMIVNDYVANFDGNSCKIGGIGGVVSDFNSPVKGLMKKINTVALEKMRKNGQYFSHLYPFEESYYRKYGYEVSAQTARWEIPVEKISDCDDGIISAYDGSEKMKNDIVELYGKFLKNKNLLFEKNVSDWEEFFEKIKAYVTDYHSILHYNNDGICDGYLNYTVIYNEHRPQDFNINELWFCDFAGLKGIISYFRTQQSYCDKIYLSLPESVDISPLLNSTGGWGKRNVSRTITNCGLSRVVDAEEVLKLASYKGEGKVCIKIYGDDYAAWNNDSFTVEYGDKIKVTRGGKADIEMKISSFTSGILGRFDFENFKIFSDIKIFNEEKNFRNVFYKKHIWTENHF